MYNADGPDIDASLAFSLILVIHSFSALEKGWREDVYNDWSSYKEVKRICVSLLIRKCRQQTNLLPNVFSPMPIYKNNLKTINNICSRKTNCVIAEQKVWQYMMQSHYINDGWYYYIISMMLLHYPINRTPHSHRTI